MLAIHTHTRAPFFSGNNELSFLQVLKITPNTPCTIDFFVIGH